MTACWALSLTLPLDHFFFCFFPPAAGACDAEKLACRILNHRASSCEDSAGVGRSRTILSVCGCRRRECGRQEFLVLHVVNQPSHLTPIRSPQFTQGSRALRFWVVVVRTEMFPRCDSSRAHTTKISNHLNQAHLNADDQKNYIPRSLPGTLTRSPINSDTFDCNSQNV